jgi:WD40 repeat protein
MKVVQIFVLLITAFGGLIACNCAGLPRPQPKLDDPQNAGADIKPRFILESGLLDHWGKKKNGPHQLHVSADGKYLLALAHTNTENIQVWDLGTLKKVRGIRANNGTMHAHCAIAPDSRTAAYIEYFPKSALVIFDMITGETQHTIFDDGNLTSNSPWRCMQFSPDGTRLVLAAKSAIVFWNIGTGKIDKTWPGRTYCLSRFFDNGARIASSNGGRIDIWDVVQGKVIKELPGASNEIGLTPDEKTIVSQGDNRPIRTWDLPEGNLRHERNEFSGTYQYIITPNNRTAIWPTNIGIIVYDLINGMKIQELKMNEPYLMGLAATPDGATLITSDTEGLIKGWRLNANGLVE